LFVLGLIKYITCVNKLYFSIKLPCMDANEMRWTKNIIAHTKKNTINSINIPVGPPSVFNNNKLSTGSGIKWGTPYSFEKLSYAQNHYSFG
jgi:hypothetical protein